MAWVTEYDMKWAGNNNTGKILIQRDGGAYIGPLKLKRGSLQIQSRIGDWETPIVRNNCSFTIVNSTDTLTRLSWNDLLPLMTISLGQYRVIVEMDPATIAGAQLNVFVGYLNCETISQDMMYYSELRLTASGLINKLKYIEPTALTDPPAKTSLIDIIDHCLRLTGGAYNIRVMCNLTPLGGYPANQTIFQNTGVFTELFWVDNIRRENALDIITMILLPLNCYLYWYQDYWYIDYYEQLGEVDRDYTEYTTGQSYQYNEPAAPANTVLVPALDVFSVDHPQIADTQIMSIKPGMHEVEISLVESQYRNLFLGGLNGAAMSFNRNAATIRQWHLYGGMYTFPIQLFWPSWNHIGEPYKNITSAARRYDFERVGHSVNGLPDVVVGVSTVFNVTAHYGSDISIKWKHGMPFSSAGITPEMLDDPGGYKFRIYWSLRIQIPGTTTYRYFAFDNDPAIGETGWGYGVDETINPANWFEVPFTDWDQKTGVHDNLEVVIPIGGDDLGPVIGLTAEGDSADFQMNFTCGTEKMFTANIPSPTDVPPLIAWYGDFVCAISGDPEPNLIKGDTLSNFLDKKSIALRIYDTGTWNYLNTLLTNENGGDYYIEKTVAWVNGKGAEGPLYDKLMESKFRIYRVARQIIRMKNYRVNMGWDTLRPLMKWTKTIPATEYILAGDTYHPEEDTHDLELFEFDDTEDINLIG